MNPGILAPGAHSCLLLGVALRIPKMKAEAGLCKLKMLQEDQTQSLLRGTEFQPDGSGWAL